MKEFVGLALLSSATALIYLYRPTLWRRNIVPIHTSAPLKFTHQLMSHRGGSVEHVENTMTAFRHSAYLEVDLLELDVQLTKDGEVVIFHDNCLKRMTGIEGSIGDYNYKDLPPLISSLTERCADSKRIPLLSEFFAEFPQYPTQIDVKNGPLELVEKVRDMVYELKRQDQTLWGSFKPAVSKMCTDTGPDIALFFSFTRAIAARLLHQIGLMHLMELRESALIVPQRLKYFNDPYWFESLRDRGISIFVFTLNSEEQWEKARDNGATGICSDMPTALGNWLIKNPLKTCKRSEANTS